MCKHNKAKLKALRREVARLQAALEFTQGVTQDILRRLYELEQSARTVEVTTQRLNR
jgi:hypothetical protein